MFIRIVLTFIPKRNVALQELQESVSKNHLRYLIGQTLIGDKGRILANIAPFHKDVESHLALRITESINLNNLFMHFVFEEAFKRELFTKENIFEFVKKSILIEQSKYFILSKALDYFLNKEYMSFMYLIIPQIEEAVRNLQELNGGNVLIFKNGGYLVKTFDTLLREAVVVETLGEDLALYYRMVFTDQKGLNLRNDLAHGIINEEKFRKQNADLVLHCLLALAMIRKNESSN